jgi:hypothetical protein
MRFLGNVPLIEEAALALSFKDPKDRRDLRDWRERMDLRDHSKV